MERLYILVNNQLPLAYQGVQAGHAVAQWLIEHPNQTWNNDYLIYLGVNELQLQKWMFRLELHKISYSKFVEPDIGNKVTAIAIQLPEEYSGLFENLKLMGA
jgi:hypothetical protein